MATNKQHTLAVREYMAKHPGTSFTKATFALRDPAGAEIPTQATSSDAPPNAEGDYAHLIGKTIEAKAPRRPARRGIVLPPAPGSRNRSLRITTADPFKPVPFNPAEWSIVVTAGHPSRRASTDDPVYHRGDLPAEHLATVTFLKTEMRRRPADGQQPIALYPTRESFADLYAVVDTAALPELSPTRSAAWTSARTCARCAAASARPLKVAKDGRRYCSTCIAPAFIERFHAARVPIRREQIEWARGTLADPSTVLAFASSTGDGAVAFYVEALDGQMLLHARVGYYALFYGLTKVKPGLMPVDELRPLLQQVLAGRTVLAWRAGELRLIRHVLDETKPDETDYHASNRLEPDTLGHRFTEWVGTLGGVPTYWWANAFPAPQDLPYDLGGTEPQFYPALRVAGARTRLELMASWDDPRQEPDPKALLPDSCASSAADSAAVS